MRVTYVPGAIGPGANHTLPSGSPSLGSVVSATITRLPAALADHAPAAIAGAILDHAVHAHDILYKANPAANAVTMAAASLHNASAGDLTVAGNGGDGGIRNNGAAQVHGAGAAPVTHVAGNPVVAATPTRVSNTQFTLNVATLVGDVLTLIYNEVGALVAVS